MSDKLTKIYLSDFADVRHVRVAYADGARDIKMQKSLTNEYLSTP